MDFSLVYFATSIANLDKSYFKKYDKILHLNLHIKQQKGFQIISLL